MKRKVHSADYRLTTIPFSGFYESLHSSNVDGAAEQIISDDRGDVIEGLAEHLFDAVNYGDVYRAYAKGYAENFGHELDLPSLQFDELNSPREYNFTTDRVFAWISRQDLYRVAMAVDLAKLAKMVKAKFTSRGGFSSYYSGDLREWPMDLGEWDHNQIGTLLECYADQWAREEGHDGFDQWAENALMEWDQCNGQFDHWLFEASPKLGRLSNIAYYLRQRSER